MAATVAIVVSAVDLGANRKSQLRGRHAGAKRGQHTFDQNLFVLFFSPLSTRLCGRIALVSRFLPQIFKICSIGATQHRRTATIGEDEMIHVRPEVVDLHVVQSGAVDVNVSGHQLVLPTSHHISCAHDAVVEQVTATVQVVELGLRNEIIHVGPSDGFTVGDGFFQLENTCGPSLKDGLGVALLQNPRRCGCCCCCCSCACVYKQVQHCAQCTLHVPSNLAFYVSLHFFSSVSSAALVAACPVLIRPCRRSQCRSVTCPDPPCVSPPCHVSVRHIFMFTHSIRFVSLFFNAFILRTSFVIELSLRLSPFVLLALPLCSCSSLLSFSCLWHFLLFFTHFSHLLFSLSLGLHLFFLSFSLLQGLHLLSRLTRSLVLAPPALTSAPPFLSCSLSSLFSEPGGFSLVVFSCPVSLSPLFPQARFRSALVLSVVRVNLVFRGVEWLHVW